MIIVIVSQSLLETLAMLPEQQVVPDLESRVIILESLNSRLNINNLTDKRYWINTRFLGDARNVVLSANLKF